ncbi:MAG: hypothetical protein RL417_1309 [Pseudomonadota bacterium]
MFFGGERSAWLAEAQGFLMVSSLRPVAAPDESTLRIGARIDIDRVVFTVKDIKEVLASFAEGELPFAAEQGSKMRSIDLTGPGRLVATLGYSEGGGEVYIGEIVEFSELQFKRMREFNGS